MSAVYNPEADIMAEIDRLELEASTLRRKLDRVVNDEDRRVINRLLNDIKEQVALLQSRLPQ